METVASYHKQSAIAVGNADSGVRLCGFESFLHRFPVLTRQASYLTSLGLSFILYKMLVVLVSSGRYNETP